MLVMVMVATRNDVVLTLNHQTMCVYKHPQCGEKARLHFSLS
jgi:hypothetical protein